MSGNLSILKRVRLTNAVFGSRLFFSSIKIKVVKETAATMKGAHDHVKPDRVLNRADFIRFAISLVLIFFIIL